MCKAVHRRRREMVNKVRHFLTSCRDCQPKLWSSHNSYDMLRLPLQLNLHSVCCNLGRLCWNTGCIAWHIVVSAAPWHMALWAPVIWTSSYFDSSTLLDQQIAHVRMAPGGRQHQRCVPVDVRTVPQQHLATSWRSMLTI